MQLFQNIIKSIAVKFKCSHSKFSFLSYSAMAVACKDSIKGQGKRVKRWQRGGENVSKVEETIEVICDWIQEQLGDGKCDTSHQVSEMVKALADIMSASAKIL